MLRIDVDRGSPYAHPRRQPVRARTPARCPRSGPTACATPGASPSTARPATSTSATSGQNARRGDRRRPRLAPRRRELRLEHHGGHAAASGPPAGCTTAGLTLPVARVRPQRRRLLGHRRRRLPRLPHARLRTGRTSTATTAAGFVRSFRLQNGARRRPARLDVDARRAASDSISSFGVDADGEVYIVDHDGEVYRIVPAG